ncbi:MAG: hypothetical protein P4L43_06685 [Syntrophobacteraceae bacterium]|nr:hypothetical protein [Syntrophobacteraceae bacterium]
MTETVLATAARISVAEVFIPCPLKVVSPFHHEPVKFADLRTAESAAVPQPYRIEPEFGHFFIPFDMNMRRFVPVTGIEEEPVWPNP